ncbi:MAG: spermidine/putrescine ABC transporter substrate-binding protein [Opitutaceae bacterium]|nr:spermidine/putrescine ABC transporter substrate-binding protein [Opitutaceae bacterium]
MENGNLIRSILAWLTGLAAACALVLSPGCSKQVLNKEAARGLAKDPYPIAPKNMAPVLRVLVWPDTLLEENKEGFERRYGVKLEIDTFINDDDAYGKITREPSRWDLVMVTQYMANRMRNEGLLAPVPKINQHIYQYIDTSLLNQNADPQMQYFIPFDYAALGISFNIDYVAGFPRKWEYLADHKNNPYLYGRIVMTDDMRYAMAVAMLYTGLDPASTNPQDIKTAKEMLIRNVRNLGLRFLPDAKIRTAMVSGEALLAITWSGEAAAILRKKPACRFLIPEGKCVVTVDGFCIPRGSASPETAALFIEYMLHPYNSMLVANGCQYASVNLRTMKYVDRFVINGPSCMLAPPQDQIHMTQLDREELRLYQEAWAEVKRAALDANRVQMIPLQ